MTKKKAAAVQLSSWSRLPKPIRYALPWVTAATATIVFLINLDKFTPIWERWQPASHEYVNHEIDGVKVEVRKDIDSTKSDLKSSLDNTNYILRDMQIEQAQGKLDASTDAVSKWKLELAKTKDPQTQTMIEGTIKEIDVRIRSLNSQLNTLNQLRAQTH